MAPIPNLAAAQYFTRRQFFSRCALGLGSIALASLLNERRAAAAAPTSFPNPMAPRPPHFTPRTKNIIYLFMAGGPSQLELFDYKPKLIELNGQPIPQSFLEGKRFAFIDRKSTRLNSSHGYISYAASCLKTRLNSSHGYISYAVFCLKKNYERIHRRD